MKTARFSSWGMALGLLLAVVLHAPAQWLASGVNAASRGHVQLRDAQGTVWRGDAQWVLTSGPGGQDALALPQRLHWQLRPQWNGLQLTLDAACCTPQPVLLQLQPVWLGLQVSLVSPRSVWPAQWLSGLGAPWNTLALNGVLDCRKAEFFPVVCLSLCKNSINRTRASTHAWRTMNVRNIAPRWDESFRRRF